MIRASLLAFFLLATLGAARAEIAMVDSVEWLTADASEVLLGKIVSHRAASRVATGKDRDLTLLTVEVTVAVSTKADDKVSVGERICVALRDAREPELVRLQVGPGELLFFLGATVEATAFEGRECRRWPLRDAGGEPAVFRLDASKGKLLSAMELRALGPRDEILAAVRTTRRRLDALAPARGPAPVPKRYLLQIPARSELETLMATHSVSYLYVPDLLFPTARKPFK